MKPAWLPDSSGKLRPPDVCDTVELSVMSMVAPLLSLSDPVMPPDYGFAITDRNGNVLFHSTAAKSGRENFLNELDDPRDVQVAIVAAQGKYVSTRYQGFPAKVFVTPFLGVQRIPWSLIVFHDLSTGSAENLERIVLFSILALLYYALVSVALFFVPRERVVPKWVWPLEERRGDYLHLIIVLLLIAPAFYALIFRVDSLAAVLLTAILVPLLCLGAGIQKLRSEFVWIMAVSIGSLLLLIPSAALSTANGPSLLLAWIYLWILSLAYPNLYRYLPKKPLPSLRNVFSALCALMLLSVGILPAVAFFRVAYNYHADLSTRRQQIQTVAALAQREARIKSRYRNLEISPGVGAADVNTWLFLRRRLDQTADRYDTVFLSLQRQAFTGFEGGRQQCDEDALPPYLVQLGARIPFGKGSLTRNLSQAPVVRNDVARLSERPPVWRWCREGINRIRLTPNTPDSKTPENSYSLPPTRALLKSVTGDPVFLYPSVVSELPLLKQWSWFWATLVFLPAWLVTFLWVRLTLGHLFLLKNSLAADPFPLMELDKQTPLSESMVLLTFDPARASKILEERGDVHLIEFTECAQGRDIDCSDIRESVIAVKDFDYKRGVETVDIKRLELLERLYVEAPGKPILLLTPVDPALHLAEGLDAATRERCLQLFYGFKRRRLAAVANAEYSTMFFASSIGERVALLQLANEGWLNPRNETALRHLQNRGIVAGTPFGFCDPEFGKYVLNSVAKADRKAWEKHDDAAIWDGIRMTFVVLLCALVAAVLFLNQQTALSYVLTGLGVLAPLTKLLSEARNLPALLGFGGKKE
jgi:hypothetical protein